MFSRLQHTDESQPSPEVFPGRRSLYPFLFSKRYSISVHSTKQTGQSEPEVLPCMFFFQARQHMPSRDKLKSDQFMLSSNFSWSSSIKSRENDLSLNLSLSLSVTVLWVPVRSRHNSLVFGVNTIAYGGSGSRNCINRRLSSRPWWLACWLIVSPLLSNTGLAITSATSVGNLIFLRHKLTSWYDTCESGNGNLWFKVSFHVQVHYRGSVTCAFKTAYCFLVLCLQC